MKQRPTAFAHMSKYKYGQHTNINIFFLLDICQICCVTTYSYNQVI